MSVAVFCDFDGTVTRKDSGDEFFRRFGDFEPHSIDLMAGRISVAEYYRRVCGSLPHALSNGEIKAFASECETDAYFGEFVRFCREKSFALCIVSDGFDRYIYPILQGMDIDLPVFCNTLTGTSPAFPGATESCECFCASCKRNVLLGVARQDDIIIYIGDGLSDTCAAEYADVVFAKGALASYCNHHKISHYPFKTFADVLYILRKNPKGRTLRRRRQAELKRMAAFEAE